MQTSPQSPLFRAARASRGANLLLLDIGNTALKIASVSPNERKTLVHLPSTASDEDLATALQDLGLAQDAQTTALASSVVPKLSARVKTLLQTRFACPLRMVPKDIPVPLDIRYEQPSALGSDRLIAAFAARTLSTAKSLIVLDVGTAITLDCVTDTTFLGGFILPGPTLAHAALHAQTAQLPEVPYLQTPPTSFALGTSTATCIQYGITFGYACLLNGLIAKTKAELPPPTQVIATGGFVHTQHLVGVDTIAENLVLEGLHALARKYQQTS